MSIGELPVIRTVLAVHRRYGQDEGRYMSASMAYFGFLSLFPLILLGLSVLGFVLDDPVVRGEWVGRLSAVVPGLGPLLERNIDAVIAVRGGAGVVGLVALLWSATRITEAAGRALGVVYGVPRFQSFVRRKRWSLVTTAGLGALALAGAAVAGVAGSLPGASSDGGLLRLGTIAVALTVDFVLFMVAYRVLVQRPGPPFTRLWPGALLAAGAWTLLKVAGSWLATTQTERTTEVYGAFAFTVAVLLLLYIAAQVFLYGAELNAVLMRPESGPGADQDPPDEDG